MSKPFKYLVVAFREVRSTDTIIVVKDRTREQLEKMITCQLPFPMGMEFVVKSEVTDHLDYDQPVILQLPADEPERVDPYEGFDADGFLEGWKPPVDYQRKVVCAANKYGEGPDALVVCAPRHHGPRMNHTLEKLREDKLFEFEVAGRAVQGFVDQHGIFMDRREAWKVAEAAKQIVRCPPNQWNGELFSEWLY